jgi:hypothetical protein
MHSDILHWFLKALTKFALFGVPSLIVLLLWRRHDVQSRILYRISAVNSVGYLAWLASCTGVGFLSASVLYRDTFIFRWLDQLCVPHDLFVFFPFFLAVGSFFMCILCGIAKKGERRYVFMLNGLTLILWSCNLVAPN